MNNLTDGDLCPSEDKLYPKREKKNMVVEQNTLWVRNVTVLCVYVPSCFLVAAFSEVWWATEVFILITSLTAMVA